MADQKQVICIRRESGNCQICYSAAAATDVALSGLNAAGIVLDVSCCAYGLDGMGNGGYDCLMIPGAMTNMAAGTPLPPSQCGGMNGLAVTPAGATAPAAATICCKYSTLFMSII